MNPVSNQNIKFGFGSKELFICRFNFNKIINVGFRTCYY